MIGTTQTQTHKHTTNDTNTHTHTHTHTHTLINTYICVIFVKKVFFEKIKQTTTITVSLFSRIRRPKREITVVDEYTVKL